MVRHSIPGIRHLVALLIFFGKTIETIQNAVPHGRTVGLVLATLIVTDVGYLAFFNIYKFVV